MKTIAQRKTPDSRHLLHDRQWENLDAIFIPIHLPRSTHTFQLSYRHSGLELQRNSLKVRLSKIGRPLSPPKHHLQHGAAPEAGILNAGPSTSSSSSSSFSRQDQRHGKPPRTGQQAFPVLKLLSTTSALSCPQVGRAHRENYSSGGTSRGTRATSHQHLRDEDIDAQDAMIGDADDPFEEQIMPLAGRFLGAHLADSVHDLLQARYESPTRVPDHTMQLQRQVEVVSRVSYSWELRYGLGLRRKKSLVELSHALRQRTVRLTIDGQRLLDDCAVNGTVWRGIDFEIGTTLSFSGRSRSRPRRLAEEEGGVAERFRFLLKYEESDDEDIFSPTSYVRQGLASTSRREQERDRGVDVMNIDTHHGGAACSGGAAVVGEGGTTRLPARITEGDDEDENGDADVLPPHKEVWHDLEDVARSVVVAPGEDVVEDTFRALRETKQRSFTTSPPKSRRGEKDQEPPRRRARFSLGSCSPHVAKRVEENNYGRQRTQTREKLSGSRRAGQSGTPGKNYSYFSSFSPMKSSGLSRLGGSFNAMLSTFSSPRRTKKKDNEVEQAGDLSGDGMMQLFSDEEHGRRRNASRRLLQDRVPILQKAARSIAPPTPGGRLTAAQPPSLSFGGEVCQGDPASCRRASSVGGRGEEMNGDLLLDDEDEADLGSRGRTPGCTEDASCRVQKKNKRSSFLQVPLPTFRIRNPRKRSAEDSSTLSAEPCRGGQQQSDLPDVPRYNSSQFVLIVEPPSGEKKKVKASTPVADAQQQARGQAQFTDPLPTYEDAPNYADLFHPSPAPRRRKRDKLKKCLSKVCPAGRRRRGDVVVED